MNICFVHEEYPNETNFGGIATYQKIMAKTLEKLDNHVYIICRSLTKSSLKVEGNITIYRLYVSNFESKKGAIAYRKKVSTLLTKLQNEKKIDIIETPDWGANTIFFERKRQIPLVVRLHTPLKIWLEYNNNNFSPSKNQILKWEDKMLLQANAITSCSKTLKDLVLKNYSFLTKDIAVIPNPANQTDFFYNEKIKKENMAIYVGSLEERKGLLILAEALNIVFSNYPDLKFYFIGKDTTRNSENISTISLIKKAVASRFHNNLVFVGQIKNSVLNDYLNKSLVAVFPSLFDNFPYAVLEAMATGTQIVGSKNSGMREMLDENSLYDTGDYEDLADKILAKLKLVKKNPLNLTNIKKLDMFNAQNIATKMLSFYEKVIKEYENANLKENLKCILKRVTTSNIESIVKEKCGVSNIVYRVRTTDNTYIIKKYLYNYNFKLMNDLYKTYENNNINCIRPLTKRPIIHNGYIYNIFPYLNSRKVSSVSLNCVLKLISCPRKTKNQPTIRSKCQKYYSYLKSTRKKSLELKKDIKYVLPIYENLTEKAILNERYLNHGYICMSNILHNKGKYYIIDFDEVTVTTPLYDFAVCIVKLFTKENKILLEDYKYLRNKVKLSFPQYKDSEFLDMVKFYLCKVLIEKFYFHETGKINLFSTRQLTDDYHIYLNILKNIDKDFEFD